MYNCYVHYQRVALLRVCLVLSRLMGQDGASARDMQAYTSLVVISKRMSVCLPYVKVQTDFID